MPGRGSCPAAARREQCPASRGSKERPTRALMFSGVESWPSTNPRSVLRHRLGATCSACCRRPARRGPLRRTRRRAGHPGRRGRLVGRPAGRPADLAAEPAHLGRHLPVVALPHPALVGAGARDDLQRRLPPDARRASTRGPGGPGSGGVDRDLGRHRADARAGDGRGWRHLVGRRAARSSTATATPRSATSPTPTARSPTSPAVSGGVFCAVTETTEQVVGERRLATWPRWPA